MNNIGKRKFLAFLLVLIIPLILFFVFEIKKQQAGLQLKKLPVLSQQALPPFELFTHTGDTLYRDSLSGKLIVADFFFTRCRGICPMMSSQMGRLQKWIKNNQNLSSEIKLISHTVDPARDSVPVLAAYAEMYGADENMWMFVTGKRDQLYELSIGFYKLTALETPEDTANLFAHSEKFILLDKDGYIRGYYDGTDSASVKLLMQDIVNLDLHYQLQRPVKKGDQ